MANEPTTLTGTHSVLPEVPYGQMPLKKCTIDDCDDYLYAKGMCQGHYRRFWRHGANVVMPRGRASVNYGKRTAKAGT